MRRKKKTIECIEYLSVSAPLDIVDRLEERKLFSSYRQSIGENRKSVGSSYRGKGSISAAGKRILYRTGI